MEHLIIQPTRHLSGDLHGNFGLNAPEAQDNFLGEQVDIGFRQFILVLDPRQQSRLARGSSTMTTHRRIVSAAKRVNAA